RRVAIIGKGKAGKSGGKATKSQSRTSKASLQFSVGCVHCLLKKGNYAQSVGAGAPVYLAVVLEYLAAEILKLVGNAAHDNKKQPIVPRHLQLAIQNDEELHKLLGNVGLSQGDCHILLLWVVHCGQSDALTNLLAGIAFLQVGEKEGQQHQPRSLNIESFSFCCLHWTTCIFVLHIINCNDPKQPLSKFM
ncbi:Histone-fold-containing protein, partial [Amanita muscaria]